MAGKNKTYELMLKIGGKVDGSLKTACSTADKNLAALGKTAKTAGKIAAGAMVAAATAVATLGTAAVRSAAHSRPPTPRAILSSDPCVWWFVAAAES